MKSLFIILFGSIFLAYGQQDYFSNQVKSAGLEFFQKQIYAGCADPKESQPLITPLELKELTEKTQLIVERKFSQAFSENPKIKDAFRKDLLSLNLDPSCQKEPNHCRAKLLGLSLYYYQQFRADLELCKTDALSPHCEVEKKYRSTSFEGVHSSNYGAPGIGTYKKQLIEEKNKTTKALFDLIMVKGNNSYHICNPVRSGEAYHYHLNIEEPGKYLTDMDPDYHLTKNLPQNCIEEKKIIHQEFIRTSIDKNRFKIGLDDVEPVKRSLSSVVSDPNLVVTDVSVVVNSAKLPNHIIVDGRAKLDPEGNTKNLALAKDRSTFVEKVFQELKKSHSYLEKVNFSTKGELAGPNFEPMDQNSRFVTHMTPGYLEKVFATFNSNKRLYQEVALMKEVDELTQEEKFGNLFQVKFKPFQGFRIVVSGFKKDEMKCLEKSSGPKKSSVIKQ